MSGDCSKDVSENITPMKDKNSVFMILFPDPSEIIHHHPVFVKDTSKYWYKPTISREQGKQNLIVIKNT